MKTPQQSATKFVSQTDLAACNLSGTGRLMRVLREDRLGDFLRGTEVRRELRVGTKGSNLATDKEVMPMTSDLTEHYQRVNCWS